MIYQLMFDMNSIDDSINKGTNTIYAEKSNMDKIQYKGIKKGFFDNIILLDREFENWPEVEFYYSSRVSNIESDLLLNIKRWPIVHKNVKAEFERSNIRGVKYFPIKLIDVVSGEINNNYFLIYVQNFIEAYDMEKSNYKYNEKYDIYTFIPNGIVMNKDICENYDIFRCNKNKACLYVSEKIKKMVEEHNWNGFSFNLMKND